MHVLQERCRTQLRLGKAEDLRPFGIQTKEVAVEARDAQEIERQIEEGVELVCRPLAGYIQPC